MNKKERIEKVMHSLDGIQPAEASPFLYDRILNRINPLQAERASVKWLWLGSFSFIFLLLLNFGVVRTNDKPSDRSDVQELSQGYQLMNTTNFNYN